MLFAILSPPLQTEFSSIEENKPLMLAKKETQCSHLLIRGKKKLIPQKQKKNPLASFWTVQQTFHVKKMNRHRQFKYLGENDVQKKLNFFFFLCNTDEAHSSS